MPFLHRNLIVAEKQQGGKGRFLRQMVFRAAFGISLVLTPLRVNAEPAQEKPVQPKKPAALDWERTHLIVINGDYEQRHLENAATAIETGLRNKAVSIRIAGLAERKHAAVKNYEAKSAQIIKMIEEIGGASALGDTIFIYITGHGDKNKFALEKYRMLDHKELLTALERHLKGRKIVFVSDTCYSANFVFMLIESKAFQKVIAMSPSLKDETTSCNYFSLPFWHAIDKRLDLDSNGIPTMQEAFLYGLARYRSIKPGTLGTYRETVPMIKSMNEVKDGIVMVTADHCEACKRMEPVFNATSILLQGNLGYYAIDQKNARHSGSIPAIFIIKNRKKVAEQIGFLNIENFSRWLTKNGVAANETKISVKELYDKGMYDSIVQVHEWYTVFQNLGRDAAIKMYKSLASHEDPNIRRIALQALGYSGDPSSIIALIEALKDADEKTQEMATRALVTMSKRAVPFLTKAMKEGNAQVQWNSAGALGMIRDTAAVPALIEALEYKELSVRRTVIRALGKIKDPAAIPALIKVLKFDKKLGWEAKLSLISIGKPAVPLLIKELGSYGLFYRQEVMSILGMIKDPSAVKALTDELDDEEPNVRYEAASALGNIGHKSALPALEELAKKEKDKDVLETIDMAIWKIKNK